MLVLGSPMSRRTRPNSSPPSRATVSPGRMFVARRSRQLGQQAVAVVVAESVVDVLEPVEVDDREGR